MGELSYRDKQEAVFSIATNWYNVIQSKEAAGELNVPVSCDDAFRFMTYWMAFNTIYSDLSSLESVKKIGPSQLIEKYKYIPKNGTILSLDKYNIIHLAIINKKQEQNNELPCFPNSEVARIVRYSASVMHKLQKYDFNYYIENCIELQKQPISCVKKSGLNSAFKEEKNLYYYRRIFEDNGAPFHVKMMSLIMTIYQIRCNLFHGDKNPINDRDLALVSEAAMIMKKILNSVLDIDNNGNDAYSIIYRNIKSFKFFECKAIKQWSDAQLVITNVNSELIINSLRNNINGINIISMEKSQALIWLINQMKPFLKTDYISKYIFYNDLFKVANQFLSKYNNVVESDERLREMMFEILESVKKYLQ